jgi:hypothetical protein
MTEFQSEQPGDSPLTELELHAATYGTFDERMQAFYDQSRSELGVTTAGHLPVQSLAEQQTSATNNHKLISQVVSLLPDMRGYPGNEYMPVKDQADARIILANMVAVWEPIHEYTSSNNRLGYIIGSRVTGKCAELLLSSANFLRNSSDYFRLEPLSIERVSATPYKKVRERVVADLSRPFSDTEMAATFDLQTRSLHLVADDWPGMAIKRRLNRSQIGEKIGDALLYFDKSVEPERQYKSADLGASVRAAGLNLKRRRGHAESEWLKHGLSDETMENFGVYMHLGNLATAFGVSVKYQGLLNQAVAKKRG